MSNSAHNKMGDIMQNNFNDFDDFDKKALKRNYYLLQKCVKVEEFYDYEFGNEFFVLAPVDVNDMYNQN